MYQVLLVSPSGAWGPAPSVQEGGSGFCWPQAVAYGVCRVTAWHSGFSQCPAKLLSCPNSSLQGPGTAAGGFLGLVALNCHKSTNW